MSLDICKDFHVTPTQAGWMVVTPFQYEDRDQIVVFADREPSGLWRVHDNGDSALRLMFDSVDPFSPKIQAWLAESSIDVEWNDKDNALVRNNVDEADLIPAALKVAQACVQLQAMSAQRLHREESTFKAEVIALLKGVAHETGIEARYDTPIDDKRLFSSDCLFLSTVPLAIFIAPSKERLLEAELAWASIRHSKDPTRVYAVVEEPRTTGLKEVSRAQYFTDKTLQFRDFEGVFREAVKDHVVPH